MRVLLLMAIQISMIKGNENDDNYSMRTLVSPTIINGDKGVNIRTVGKTKDDNLVLQATGITFKKW